MKEDRELEKKEIIKFKIKQVLKFKKKEEYFCLKLKRKSLRMNQLMKI
jgi:hypothetical protein